MLLVSLISKLFGVEPMDDLHTAATGIHCTCAERESAIDSASIEIYVCR
jgi:hypothetical protein